MSAVLDSFPTLRPTDSLPARMRRVWSSTYRTEFSLLFCYPHRDDENAMQFDERKATRAQAAAVLRYARSQECLVELGKGGRHSVFLCPHDLPAALRALPAGRK